MGTAASTESYRATAPVDPSSKVSPDCGKSWDRGTSSPHGETSNIAKGMSAISATCEIKVTGDDEQAYQTTLKGDQLKKSLLDVLLAPFIRRVQHDRGIQVVCSYIEVNGHAIKDEQQLQRPVTDFVIWLCGRGMTKLLLTLVQVDTNMQRISRHSSIPRRSKLVSYAVNTLDAVVMLEEPRVQLGTVASTVRSPTNVEAMMGMSRPLADSGSSARLFFIDDQLSTSSSPQQEPSLKQVS